MAVNLETLVLEFQADFSEFERALDSATTKAQSKAKKLENLKITPEVDLRQLHELNRVLDAKQKHLMETRKLFLDNPIVAVVKTEQSGDSGQDQIEEDTKKFVDALKRSAQQVKNIAAPFEMVFTGVFEGIGNEIGKKIGKGFNKNLQQELGFTWKDLGKKAGDITAYSVRGVAGSMGVDIPEAKKGKKGNTPSGDQGEEVKIPVAIAKYQKELDAVTVVLKHTQTGVRELDTVLRKAANIIDGVVTTTSHLVPGGSTALNAAKTGIAVSAPFAVAAGVESFVPGGSALIHGIQTGIGLGLHSLSGQVSQQILSQLLPVIQQITGVLPIGGQALGGALSEVATTGITGALSGAAGVTETVAGAGVAGKGIIDVAGATKDKLLGHDKESLKQLKGQTEQLKLKAVEATSEAYQLAERVANGFNSTAQSFRKGSDDIQKIKRLIKAADKGKQLKPEQIKLIAATVEKNVVEAERVINDYNAVSEVIDAQVEKMPQSEKGFGGRGARLKAKISNTNNAAQDFINFAQRFIKNPTSEVDRQVYDAITVDAVRIGKNTQDGIDKGVDPKQARKKGKDIGDELQGGTKDSLGIKSPSLIYKIIGKDIVLGLKLGLIGIRAVLDESNGELGEALKSQRESIAQHQKNLEKISKAKQQRQRKIAELKQLRQERISEQEVDRLVPSQESQDRIKELQKRRQAILDRKERQRKIAELKQLRPELIDETISRPKIEEGVASLDKMSKKIDPNSLQALARNERRRRIEATKWLKQQAKEVQELKKLERDTLSGIQSLNVFAYKAGDPNRQKRIRELQASLAIKKHEDTQKQQINLDIQREQNTALGTQSLNVFAYKAGDPNRQKRIRELQANLAVKRYEDLKKQQISLEEDILKREQNTDLGTQSLNVFAYKAADPTRQKRIRELQANLAVKRQAEQIKQQEIEIRNQEASLANSVTSINKMAYKTFDETRQKRIREIQAKRAVEIRKAELKASEIELRSREEDLRETIQSINSFAYKTADPTRQKRIRELQANLAVKQYKEEQDFALKKYKKEQAIDSLDRIALKPQSESNVVRQARIEQLRKSITDRNKARQELLNKAINEDIKAAQKYRDAIQTLNNIASPKINLQRLRRITKLQQSLYLKEQERIKKEEAFKAKSQGFKEADYMTPRPPKPKEKHGVEKEPLSPLRQARQRRMQELRESLARKEEQKRKEDEKAAYQAMRRQQSLDKKAKEAEIQKAKEIRAAKEKELERLIKERNELLNPLNAIKNPKAFAKRAFRGKYKDSKIEALSQELAEEGTQAYADGLIRKAGNRLRNKIFKGVDPKDRGAMAGEAMGMVASAATMYHAALPVIGAMSPLIVPITPVLAAGFGLSRLLNPLMKRVEEALLATEPTMKRYQAIAGMEGQGSGLMGGQEDIDFATQIAEKYKISTKVALDSYARLKVGAHRSKLEGDGVKELFEGITASMKALRLSTYESELVFNAYVQMLSKGKISMEELRQQLGEKFPPAMSIFAKSLGVSIQELNRLSSQGSLLSEDVLSKVGSVLLEDFGSAAKSAGTDYLGALTLMENATFDLNAKLSKQFGGLFAFITNRGTDLVKFLSNNLETVTKLIGTALIGLTAQIGVGLSVILNSSVIAPKLASLQTIVFAGMKSAFTSLSPFIFGMLIDIMDDVFGAENSLFDNMSKGVANAFTGIFAGIDNTLRNFTGTALFGSLAGEGENPFLMLFHGAKKLFGILPSGLVEAGALFIMFEQVMVLIKMLGIPTFAGLGKALVQYGKVAKDVLFSGGMWKKYFNVMAADSMSLEQRMKALAMAKKALLAVAIIALARSDFSDPLISAFQRLDGKIQSSIDGIKTALEGLKPAVDDAINSIEGVKFQSKGLELNPGVWLGITDNSIKSDDFIKKQNEIIGNLNVNRKNPFDFNTRDRANKYGVSSVLGSGNLTLAEKQFVNQAEDLTVGGENLKKAFEDLNLTGENQSSFLDKDKQKALDDIAEIDRQLGELGAKRFKLSLEGTPEAKKEIVEIREQIRALYLQRQEKIKPFEALMEDVDSVKASLQQQLEEINNSNLPGVAKRLLRGILNPQIELVDEVIAYLESKGFRDVLDPLADSWAEVTDKLKDAEIAFDNLKTKSRLSSTLAQVDIYNTATGKSELTRQLDDERLAQLTTQTDQLSTIVRERSMALEQLLAIPQVEEDEERQKEIEALRKELTSSEQELAESKLSLAKARREIIEARRLKELNSSLSSGFLPIGASQDAVNFKNFGRQLELESIRANQALSANTISYLSAASSLDQARELLNANNNGLSRAISTLETTFQPVTQQWFLDLIGSSAGSIGEALQTLGQGTLAQLRAYNQGSISDTPDKERLFNTVEQIVNLKQQAQSQELALAQSKTSLLQTIKTIREAYEQFTQTLSDRLEETTTQVKRLDIKGKFLDFQNALKQQFTAGSQSIFRSFIDVFASALDKLEGFGDQNLSFEDELRANAKTLQDLSKQYQQVSTDLNALKDPISQINSSSIEVSDNLQQLAKTAEDASKAISKINDSTNSSVTSQTPNSFTPLTSKVATEVVPATFVNPYKEKLATLEQEYWDMVNPRREENKRATISDLAMGKGYDPSRFEGSIPGVTPAGLTEFRQKEQELTYKAHVALESEYRKTKQHAEEFTTSLATSGEGFKTQSQDIPLSLSELSNQLDNKVKLGRDNLNKEVTGWVRELEDNLANALSSISDKTKEAAESFKGFGKSLNDLGRQFGIIKENPVEQGVREASEAYDSQLKSILDFENSLKKDLSIDESADLSGMSSNQIKSLIRDNVDVAPILSNALENTPVNTVERGQIESLQSQYLNGLITNRDVLIGLLAQLDELKNRVDQDKNRAIARQEFVGNQEIETNRIESDNEKLNKAMEVALDKPFISDSSKRVIEQEKIRINLKEEYRKKLAEVSLKEFDGELTAQQALNERIWLEKLYQKELDQSLFKTTEKYQILEELSSGLEGALSNAFTGIGDSVFKPLSGEKRLKELEATEDYAKKLRDAQEQYADDPAQLQKVTERLEMLNNVKLDGIKEEFSLFGSILGTLKNAVMEFGKTIVQTFAKIAAQKIATGIFGGLFGGGGIFGFANGGEVQNYAEGGMVGSLNRAMMREGYGAVPIVAHKGEQILTTRNGDAQFFRALQKSGTWDELKNGGVKNYNYGGMVGNASMQYNKNNNTTNNRYGNKVNIVTNYNVVTKGDSFNRSSSQCIAEAEARNKRYYERSK